MTRIERDGAMQRRVVDTCAPGWSDGPDWEDLARRALAVPPPCSAGSGLSPVPGQRGRRRQVLVAEHDLRGLLLAPGHRHAGDG